MSYLICGKKNVQAGFLTGHFPISELQNLEIFLQLLELLHKDQNFEQAKSIFCSMCTGSRNIIGRTLGLKNCNWLVGSVAANLPCNSIYPDNSYIRRDNKALKTLTQIKKANLNTLKQMYHSQFEQIIDIYLLM